MIQLFVFVLYDRITAVPTVRLEEFISKEKTFISPVKRKTLIS